MSKVAGIDVHKKVVMVVVIDRHNPDAKPERRRFLTMPTELQQLSLWLQDRGVEEVVMESTARTGGLYGWSWSRTCVCIWPRHIPTAHLEAVSMTSRMQNDWCAG